MSDRSLTSGGIASGIAAWAPPPPFAVFDRAGWAAIGRGRAPAGVQPPSGSPLDAAEWSDVYVPLAHFVGIHLDHRVDLRRHSEADGWRGIGAGPLVVALAGSVAVGKSTCAHALAALIAARPEHPAVTVIGTDGFLFSNAELAARELLMRKGFPESYDRALVADVLGRVALGYGDVEVPRYSHRLYDITDERVSLGRPDVLIVEGVNALDPSVADFASLLIYLDAAEAELRNWFAARFAALVADAVGDPHSFFASWAGMSEEQIEALAATVWESVNAVNLHQHILPTRWRADVVLRKGAGHAVTDVAIRLR